MTTIIRDVHPLGAPELDIVIRDGLIEAIGPGAGEGIAGAEVIDGEGRLVFPGLIDAHGHMDKTLMGLPWHRNEVGPALLDMIENERRVRREEGIDFHEQSMRHARAAIAVGTTHIRTHVDVDTAIRPAILMSSSASPRNTTSISISMSTNPASLAHSRSTSSSSALAPLATRAGSSSVTPLRSAGWTRTGSPDSSNGSSRTTS